MILDFGLKNGTHTVTEAALKARMKALGLRVNRVAEALPVRRVGDVIGRQLLRAGTSVERGRASIQNPKSRIQNRPREETGAC